MLADGYHDVPLGKLATVVTYLEMRARAKTRAVPAPDGWKLSRIPSPSCDWYRSIFTDVGANWLWFSRLQLDDTALGALLSDPDVHVYTLQKDGTDGALMELSFRETGQCELSYFGLAAPLIGTGAGRFLMNAAIDTAWRADITRLHLQTCTLDSPQALGFYRRTGFVPTHQKVQIVDDPRLKLGFDKALAPHIPIFAP